MVIILHCISLNRVRDHETCLSLLNDRLLFFFCVPLWFVQCCLPPFLFHFLVLDSSHLFLVYGVTNLYCCLLQNIWCTCLWRTLLLYFSVSNMLSTLVETKQCCTWCRLCCEVSLMKVSEELLTHILTGGCPTAGKVLLSLSQAL